MKNIDCPLPQHSSPFITMAHGSGGKLTQELIDNVFMPAFNNSLLSNQHDGAIFVLPTQRIAFTTDSFVVDPLFFPGGNIGDLAINGTINDLSCCGASPHYLSAAFILEEGFPIAELEIIVNSMAVAAKNARVQIVTGDTKVVPKGKADKVFINTTGIGLVPVGIRIDPHRAEKGDAILITGLIGEHGITILSTRENLGFETSIKSDTAPLSAMVSNLLASIPDVHVLRDPTRGGVASVLNEIADAADVTIEINESALPISESVLTACELLGLDPLYVANEGILIVILPQDQAQNALEIIRNSKYGSHAAIIGKVTANKEARVWLKNSLGKKRIIERLPGDQLPRIC